MIEDPAGELTDDEGTRYRFEQGGDRVQMIEDDEVAATYRWLRATELTVEDRVKVDFHGRTYEWVDFDNTVAAVTGEPPFGIAEASPIVWYVDRKRNKDIAILKSPSGSTIGGIVPNVPVDNPRRSFRSWFT